MFIKNFYMNHARCGTLFTIRKFSNTTNLKCWSYQDLKSNKNTGLLCARKDETATFFRRNMFAVPDKMNAWQSAYANGLKDMHLSPGNVPSITHPSEILIKVSASSVNPLDVYMIDMNYGRGVFAMLHEFCNDSGMGGNLVRPPFPLIAGRDFAGEVVGVGKNVSDVQPEDKVWGVVLPYHQGSHAEYVVANSCTVSKRPDNISDIEAASIPFVGLTAWQAAVCTARLHPYRCHDKKILVVGASGGVGTFMTQLLSSWEAEVTGICRKEAFDLVLSCGASEVYDYNDPETFEKLSANPTFDVVFDLNQTGDSKWMDVMNNKFSSYVSLLSPLLSYTDRHGVVLGAFKTIENLLKKNMASLPDRKFLKWAFFYPDKRALNEIRKLVSEKKIRPIIDKVYKMSEGKEAYEHVINGSKRGKVVIDVTS